MFMHQRRHVRSALAFGTLFVAAPAFAHHPGGGGNTGAAGPVYTIPASTLDEGQTAVGVMFEIVRLRTLSDQTLTNAAANGNEGVHDLKTIESTSAVLAYGVTKDLTASVRLPWVGRTGIREGEDLLNPVVVDRGSAAGFSDVTLLSQYRFFNDKSSRTEAALLLGVKAPTGVTNRVDKQGELFDAEFQPGSGAWNGLFGLAFTKRAGAWSFDTNVLYALSGNGTQDTNLGDRLLYNAALSYRLATGSTAKVGPMHLGALPEPMYHGGPKDAGSGHSHDEPAAAAGPSVDLVLELNGEWHDQQVTAGVKDRNSGGNVVFLSPGVRLSVDKWSGYLSFGIPVVSEPNGIQPEPSWRIVSGVSLAF
jgi:hypothetical protein